MNTDLVALFQVVVIDVTLAGDNAVVVGMAVAGLPPKLKQRAILAGLGAATVLRIGLSAVALSLLAVLGLTLAGGILLLWVCWKMFRELRAHHAAAAHGGARHKTLGQAITQIMLADLSMSLDNVLAVAGAAHSNMRILAVGLILSVVLMAAAANLIARLLETRRWIAWLGFAIVFYVSVEMIVRGWAEVATKVAWIRLHL